MTSATSATGSTQRNNGAQQRTAAARQLNGQHGESTRNEPGRKLLMGTEEAAVLKLDLSDITLPKMGGLQVDGFKPSFFARLFGKR